MKKERVEQRKQLSYYRMDCKNKKTATSMETTSNYIDYIEEEQLKIVFTTLVIRVKSINKYFGSLHDFCSTYKISGLSNGKLFALADMMQPSGYLNAIIDEQLIPLGFTYKEDCVILYEQLTEGVERYKEQHHDYAHPETYDIKWLGSLVTRKGNFVWEVNYEELNDVD